MSVCMCVCVCVSVCACVYVWGEGVRRVEGYLFFYLKNKENIVSYRCLFHHIIKIKIFFLLWEVLLDMIKITFFLLLWEVLVQLSSKDMSLQWGKRPATRFLYVCALLFSFIFSKVVWPSTFRSSSWYVSLIYMIISLTVYSVPPMIHLLYFIVFHILDRSLNREDLRIFWISEGKILTWQPDKVLSD